MVDLSEIKNNLRRTFTESIKSPVFLEAALAIGTMYEPKSNLKKKDIPSTLKDDFLQKQTHPFSHQELHSSYTVQTETNWVFRALKSTNHFLPQFLPQIRCLMILRSGSIIISIDGIFTDNIIRKVINVYTVSTSPSPPLFLLGGQFSVLNFEKGGGITQKMSVWGDLKGSCHGYLPGGLSMFLVKKRIFKIKYSFEGSLSNVDLAPF